jgi:predicted DCC family thiol-disulfide oxidoreductase YuxK
MGDRLTVYYDGSCPICSREIGFYRARPGADGFDWVNVAGDGSEALGPGLSRDAALARMHVRRADGALLTGAAALPKCGGVCLGSDCWVRCFRYRRSWRSLNWATGSF